MLPLLIAASACTAEPPDDSAPDRLSGHYVWGGEVNVFSPCGSDREYWVTGDPEVLRALRDRYTAFGLPPYTAVFAELRGEFGPVLDCGFCQEYDGSLEVTEAIRMQSPGPDECVTEIGARSANEGS